MMIQPFLGATIFNGVQVFFEIILWLLLIYGVSKSKLNKLDIALLLVYFTVSVFSLVFNDIVTFALNFKIYGLCIFTMIYFRKVEFKPMMLIFLFAVANIIYSILVKYLKISILETAWFMEKQGVYALSRPMGLLGSPHATTSFLALYLLFLFQTGRMKIFQTIILYSMILYASWTALASMGLQIIYNLIRKFFGIPLNPFVFLGGCLLALFFSVELIISIASEIEGSRYYSFEQTAPQIFDPAYYQGAFPLYPKSSANFIDQQESTFADVGNELGFIRASVEGGVFLALLTIYAILKRCNFFSVLFLTSLLHYSFFINVPIILFLAMTFNKEIEEVKLSKLRLKFKGI